MFDTICTLPLSSDIFAQAVHPTEPLLAVGLSSGHVSTLKLPAVDEQEAAERTARGRRGSEGRDVVDTAWRTKRHKGSCRCLVYSVDGAFLYSAGTDGVLKAADSETGRVTGKGAIPPDTRGDLDAPTVVHALSPQTLLLATDSGALHLYDLRDPAPSLPLGEKTAFTQAKPSQTHYPHTDYISSLSPLPPSSASTSGYSKQWLTTGGTTLALTDLRRGVLVKSEDQEEILLSSLYVTRLPAKKRADGSGSAGEKALVGGGDGVITLWEKGQWDDQDERITVSKEKETIDAIAEIPEGVAGYGKKVAVGLGDGMVRFVKLGQNRVVSEVQHDEVEGVIGLSFDAGGRMISGGGQVIKVWQEHVAAEEEEEAEEEEDAVAGVKHDADSDDDDDEDDEGDDGSEEEEKPRKRRKKRKRGKGPTKASGFSFAGLD